MPTFDFRLDPKTKVYHVALGDDVFEVPTVLLDYLDRNPQLLEIITDDLMTDYRESGKANLDWSPGMKFLAQADTNLWLKALKPDTS